MNINLCGQIDRCYSFNGDDGKIFSVVRQRVRKQPGGQILKLWHPVQHAARLSHGEGLRAKDVYQHLLHLRVRDDA